MEANSSNWIAEIIAFAALICGLIGAWVRDRVGIAHRLTKLETRQDMLIEQHTETNRLLQEFLKEYRHESEPK